MPASVQDAIDSGLLALGLDTEADQRNQLGAYVRLLDRWNRSFNLTGVREPIKMVSHHVLDSASVLPYLRGKRIIDVGSGAGFPGMVVAILEPAKMVCLLDSNGKKVRFLRQAKIELGIDNVEVVQARAESYHPTREFSTILVRALGSVAELQRLTRLLRGPDSILIAMKGAEPFEELDELQRYGIDYRLVRIRIPGIEQERSIVVVPGAAVDSGNGVQTAR